MYYTKHKDARPYIKLAGAFIINAAPGCGGEGSWSSVSYTQHGQADLTIEGEYGLLNHEILLIEPESEILYVLGATSHLDSVEIWFMQEKPDLLNIRLLYPNSLRYDEHLANFVEPPHRHVLRFFSPLGIELPPNRVDLKVEL